MSGLHTPGPWSFHQISNPSLRPCELDGREWLFADYTIGSGEKMIAEVHFSTSAPGWPKVDRVAEFEANAHLIAAAPEMLRVLEEVAEGNCDHNDVLSALAKARGEA